MGDARGICAPARIIEKDERALFFSFSHCFGVDGQAGPLELSDSARGRLDRWELLGLTLQFRCTAPDLAEIHDLTLAR